jgi:hypothetical protein
MQGALMGKRPLKRPAPGAAPAKSSPPGAAPAKSSPPGAAPAQSSPPGAPPAKKPTTHAGQAKESPPGAGQAKSKSIIRPTTTRESETVPLADISIAPESGWRAIGAQKQQAGWAWFMGSL